MNLSPQYPSGKVHLRGKPGVGFTLVELMVSITIVVIMVLLFGQMLATTSQVWAYGHGRANNFTKARAMLELFAQDVQSGVFRPDLAAFPSGSPGTGGTPPVWEFYTARPGIPGSGTTSSQLRNVSVVQYGFVVPTNTGGIISNSLSRADFPIVWTGTGSAATNLLFGNTAAFTPAQPSSAPPTTPPTALTNRDTAPGVIAFDVIFIQADGTFSPTFTPLYTAGVASSNPTRAISVTLAVIDDITVPKLSTAQLATLNSLLTSAAVTPNPPLRSVKSYWDGYLNGGMSWSSYPKSLGSGMATFERYISLPNAP